MAIHKFLTRIVFLFALVWAPGPFAEADGAYFGPPEAVAISADQRAIIVKNGKHVSMTLTTGYTGDGEDFGWVIPVPNPPAVENIAEASAQVRSAFGVLDEHTAPRISQRSGGCFPPGTDVLTANGPRRIETIEPETKVWAYDVRTGEWRLQRVRRRLTHRYEGDMITIRLDSMAVETTGNHPIHVLRGSDLTYRPVPKDLHNGPDLDGGRGRWVEARDLRVGDVVTARDRGEASVLGVSSRHEKIDVYNLTVEGDHNYAVGRIGILVHNKGLKEGAPSSLPAVRVFGTVMLEHYEVSVLSALAGAALLDWLEKQAYHISAEARGVLDEYIDRGWAFVAVKLNPDGRRRYEEEFLPPLTIKFESEELTFPLRISSVSTLEQVKISLYVVAESTVSSTNFPTVTIAYRTELPRSADPEGYIERRIRTATGPSGRRLALLWSGALGRGDLLDERADAVMKELMAVPFPASTRLYLTRLEARMAPEAMTKDILLALDPTPREFPPPPRGGTTRAGVVTLGFEPEWFSGTAQSPAGPNATVLLSGLLIPPSVIPAWEFDLLWSTSMVHPGSSHFVAVEASASFFLASLGLSAALELTETGQIPYLGFLVRLLDIPLTPWSSVVRAREPLVNAVGFDVLPLTIRFNLLTGEPLFTVGIATIRLGHYFEW